MWAIFQNDRLKKTLGRLFARNVQKTKVETVLKLSIRG